MVNNKKLLIIDKCNECYHFNNNEYGRRCFHPKVVKPHEEGCIPKKIPIKNAIEIYNIKIPNWCPLTNFTGK